ncbi:YfcE family phosphodiesterase [bacterium]|nr:YfcE family phosphodiesterase [bacterium]
MPKIAIISDSHDNIVRIDQMLKKINKLNIRTIIHCGDVCTADTLKYLCNNFSGKIYLSLGNVDIDHGINQKNLKNIKIFPKFGEIKIDNLKIAFVHYPDKAKRLAKTKKYDFVFYGHTHQPWEEKINDCKVINPGTLAGLFTGSTFAILDTTLSADRQETKKMELVIL